MTIDNRDTTHGSEQPAYLHGVIGAGISTLVNLYSGEPASYLKRFHTRVLVFNCICTE